MPLAPKKRESDNTAQRHQNSKPLFWVECFTEEEVGNNHKHGS